MPKLIISFGFRHGIPALSSKDRMIDVRRHFNRNPFHNKSLRSLRGDDPRVQEDIEQTPDFVKSYNHLKKQVIKCEGDVYLGCTGGHHRSVYLAIRLGEELGVDVLHLNYNDR